MDREWEREAKAEEDEGEVGRTKRQKSCREAGGMKTDEWRRRISEG